MKSEEPRFSMIVLGVKQKFGFIKQTDKGQITSL